MGNAPTTTAQRTGHSSSGVHTGQHGHTLVDVGLSNQSTLDNMATIASGFSASGWYYYGS
jgi:hypothetical protein